AGGDRYLGPWALDAPFAAAVIVFLLPALVVSAAALEASGAAARRLARRAIRTSPAGAVRDALAESLGDGTLAIAYWLPDRAIFVDEHGAPVTLPEPASGRSWTAVEHGGRRVAAIVHDAELEARPELVQAAASGAVLALENEQLKADLRARVAELRSSRKRLVQASVDARRKLERDLHDGAQQQLVALSLDLQLLKARVADEELRRSIDASAARLADALAELRELARGIHPAILTERGLAPSLEALAGRVPLPVELDLRLDGRLPAPVEAAAYFVVAEALTNVAKYAEAGSAVVSLRRAGDLLEVEIADDGVGGADPERGSGLRGLADRLGAVDGTLSVESPPGAGTRVLARVPCAGSEDA
ncbi:MAG TPA: histidine kinase, partial [Gaiellaceae bacterium]|nr:histidine kinase [Gaiellaceae bacterium]